METVKFESYESLVEKLKMCLAEYGLPPENFSFYPDPEARIKYAELGIEFPSELVLPGIKWEGPGRGTQYTKTVYKAYGFVIEDALGIPRACLDCYMDTTRCNDSKEIDVLVRNCIEGRCPHAN